MTAPPGVAPAMAAPTGPAGATGSTTFRRSGASARARRWLRVAAGFAGLLVGYGILAAVLGGTSGSQGDLDTSSAAPGGTMAIANLLRNRGVAVTAGSDIVSALDSHRNTAGALDPDLTTVVVQPGLLDAAGLRSLGELVQVGGDVVLVEPDAAVLDALQVPVRAHGQSGPAGTAAPDCPLTEAVTAGDATLSADLLYGALAGSAPADQATVTFCYPASSTAAALAVVAPPGAAGRLTLLGGSAFLTNDRLADDGDAALALGLLARHHSLAWVIQDPVATDPVDGKPLPSLLPRWFWLAGLQLVVALVLLALWRGRRLGPPVPEPLPVVVRASETTEGHGRLYAAARARETAAEALRAGLRARLADRLGLPTARPGVGTVRAGSVAAEVGGGPDRAVLVAAVAERTGRDAVEIGALLYGAGGPMAARLAPVAVAPAGAAAPGLDPALDDAALLRLAEALDNLDRQVGGR
jgi:hypothetical protein